MKATGTFDSMELRSLLEAAQSERATGTLNLSDSGRTATLYFLFGHLFHAIAGASTGDDAVMSALVWPTGAFNFDPKAKLPADDTVRSNIPDLLVRIDSGERPASATPTPAPTPAPAPAPPEAAPPRPIPASSMPAPIMPTVTLFAPSAGPIPSRFAIPPQSAPQRNEVANGWGAPVEPGGWAQTGQPTIDPTTPLPKLPTQPTAENAPPQPPRTPSKPPPARSEVVKADPGHQNSASMESKAQTVAHPKKSVKHRPEPRVGREPFPVPAGQLIYDSLKTSFVDFPRVITTLEKEGYTGYIRLLTDETSGLIFFREGAALECVYDDGRDVRRGKEALAALNADVTEGNGVLDVVSLSNELVAGLFDLTISEALYTELYASWVDFAGLLDFLKERHQTCVVTARSDDKTGVVILTQGDVVGSYTSDSRDISQDLGPVLALCKNPQTMIEVKSTIEGTHPNLDVAEIVGVPRHTGMFPVVPPPAPAPSYTPPAPAPPAAPVSFPPPANPSPPPGNRPDFSPPVAQTQPVPYVSAVPSPTPGSISNPNPIPNWNSQPAGFPPSAPARQPQSGQGGTDWERVIDNLQNLAEEALGNRSRKVKDILAASDRSSAGVADAINQIPAISLLFVDSSRLEQLAAEMRSRVQGLV